MKKVAFVITLFSGILLLSIISVNGGMEETRNEKTYKDWINSLDVHPPVNNLYSDLTDGLVICQLFDIIQPGIVDWARVHKTSSPQEKSRHSLENCNYVLQLGNKVKNKMQITGISGEEISHGNPSVTLALCWELMRAHTLSILTQLSGSDSPRIAEKEIVQWTNDKLLTAGKGTTIRNFQDPTIQDAKVVVDLIDAIKPGLIDYSLIKDPEEYADAPLKNAKYALETAKEAGARVFVAPEDIVNVKKELVMTVFAGLMELSIKSETVSNKK